MLMLTPLCFLQECGELGNGGMRSSLKKKQDVSFDKADFITSRVKEYYQATTIKDQSEETMKVIKSEKFISWLPPPEDWYKLNINRAVEGCPSPLACGGITRDSLGRFISAFKSNLEVRNAAHSELNSVFYGLKLA